MLHGVNRWQENVVYLCVNQLFHVTVNQLDRIAGLASCILLRQTNCLIICRLCQKNVVSKRGKERICHREELVNHQRKRHADSLFSRVALACVAVKQQLIRLMVKLNVFSHFFVSRVHMNRLSGKLIACKGRFFSYICLFCKKCHAKCTANGKVWIDDQTFTIKSAKCCHDARIVCHAALKHDMVSDWLCSYNFMQIIFHDCIAKTRRNLVLRDTLCRCRRNRCLNKNRTALA